MPTFVPASDEVTYTIYTGCPDCAAANQRTSSTNTRFVCARHWQGQVAEQTKRTIEKNEDASNG